MAQQINELSSTNKSITLMLMTILAGLIHWICTANENWYCGGCVWYLGRCIWYLGLCIWYLARYIWYLVRYTWYWARWVLYLNWICTSVRVSPFSHQAVPTNFTSMLHFNSLPFSAHQSDGPWLACELTRRREDCANLELELWACHVNLSHCVATSILQLFNRFSYLLFYVWDLFHLWPGCKTGGWLVPGEPVPVWCQSPILWLVITFSFNSIFYVWDLCHLSCGVWTYAWLVPGSPVPVRCQTPINGQRELPSPKPSHHQLLQNVPPRLHMVTLDWYWIFSRGDPCWK